VLCLCDGFQNKGSICKISQIWLLLKIVNSIIYRFLLAGFYNKRCFVSCFYSFYLEFVLSCLLSVLVLKSVRSNVRIYDSFPRSLLDRLTFSYLAQRFLHLAYLVLCWTWYYCRGVVGFGRCIRGVSSVLIKRRYQSLSCCIRSPLSANTDYYRLASF